MPESRSITIIFEGGPRDGHEQVWPSPAPEGEFSVPTLDGVWVGELPDGLPEDSGHDYRMHRYLLLGRDDEGRYRYVHESRLPPDPDQ